MFTLYNIHTHVREIDEVLKTETIHIRKEMIWYSAFLDFSLYLDVDFHDSSQINLAKISPNIKWRSHSSDYLEYYLLECDTM
jgi:hypothetical protein